MIKKSATFFTLKLRRNICKIIIGIARRDRYKIFTTKNNFKGENSYKNYIKNISIFVRLATAKPVFFNEHKLPARANGTKREAVWYSELYLFRKGIENRVHGGDELRRI